MTKLMLRSAEYYHRNGLCVIPIAQKSKAPAIPWQKYHTTRSTLQEVRKWFSNGREYNIGIVHGEVSYNYISLDIDHDQGLCNLLQRDHPHLMAGAIEQSGSLEGYHIPLRVAHLPDFGNKTWHTPHGSLNIRVRGCQTVVPPSVHPSGHRYRFIQFGAIISITCLDELMNWLDEITPRLQAPALRPLEGPSRDCSPHPGRIAQYYGEIAVAAARRTIQDAPDGGKHFALLRAARLLGGYIAGGLLQEPECVAVLEEEIHKKPNVKSFEAATATIERGIEHGKASPITLEDELRNREAWIASNGKQEYTELAWGNDCKMWERVR